MHGVWMSVMWQVFSNEGNVVHIANDQANFRPYFLVYTWVYGSIPCIFVKFVDLTVQLNTSTLYIYTLYIILLHVYTCHLYSNYIHVLIVLVLSYTV